MRQIRQELRNFTENALQRSKASSRNELYTGLVEFFERENLNLTATERDLVCDILRTLIHGVEMSLRMAVAERLADNPEAPHDLILLLANDCIEVARPVLTCSAILDDRSLIELIASKALHHKLCIATRKNLSGQVSSALVATGERQILLALLDNATANIPPESYKRILTHSNDDESLKKPLALRPDLPQDLAEKLYLLVSNDLKTLIRANFKLPAAVLDQALSGAIESLASPDGADVTNAARLVEKLHAGGQLTAAFLIKSLNQNQYDFFEHAFARLLNLPTVIFQNLLKSREVETLAVSCRAVGIDRSVFMTVYRLHRRTLGLLADLTQPDIDRVQSIFQDMDKRKAEITIHSWAAETTRRPIF